MRIVGPRTLIITLCLGSISAIAQEATIVRVGVALLRGGAERVSLSDARSRLLKDLNHRRIGKKGEFEIQAVALDSMQLVDAIKEARKANCQLVLLGHLASLLIGKNPAGSAGLDYAVPTTATVEYQVIRVINGAEYAKGSVTGDDPASVQEAVLHAMSHVAREIEVEIAKAGLPPAEPLETDADADQPVDNIANVIISQDLCGFLPRDIPHHDALRGVCQFALSLREKMPNFMCDQQTSRYAGDDRTPEDLVSAVVRYEDGSESYSDIKVNGRPTKRDLAQSAGLWSKGEFGGDLRAIFDERNHPVFQYSGEKQTNERAAWVFTYKIAKQNDRLWELRGETGALAPGYGGELWIDQQSGQLLRFRATTGDIPATFLIRRAEILTEYSRVSFADGTGFVLPSDSTIATTYHSEEKMRNVVQFRGCHKFRATAHMILNVSSPPAGVTGGSGETRSGEMTREAEQDEEIYSILQAQAIREDATRLEAEQRQESSAATSAAFDRVAALRKQSSQQQNANPRELAANNTLPVEAKDATPSRTVPTFKARANLVLVSVVLRDSKGGAVGGLAKDDFLLLNDRKPQAISSFSVEKLDRASPGGAKAEKSPVANLASKTNATESNIAYVFDDLHLELGDLARETAAAQKYLAGLPAGSRAAVFTTSGETVVDFTSDVSQLQTALAQLKPRGRGDPAGCPSMNYYEADLIVNQSDENALGLATQEALDCMFHGIKPGPAEINMAARSARAKAFELLASGKAESDAALQNLGNVIRRTAAMPGRRSIVLVSPGFLMLTPEAQQAGMSLIESAVQAGIVVNALDVSGLGATPVAGDNSPGVAEAKSQLAGQEAFARTGVMADLAHGTGGTFFHNNEDLDRGFRQTADAPKYIYVLAFSPGKLDGKFHKLKVMLKTKQKLTVQARSGYYAPPPVSPH